jgi:hypothetical protein
MEFLMRIFGAFVVTALLWLTVGAATAFTIPPLPSLNNAPMLREAKLVCGMVDGKFKCKNVKDGTIGIEFDDGKKKTTPGETNEENGGAGGDDAEAGGGGAGGGGAEAGTDAKPGEPDCPEGYKVLDPPSKFGPCEPPEGLPNNAYVQCPSGATGTPPSCICPGESVYGPRGNKGQECPEGYKVLNPPSKFGPCEPPEGLPNNAYVQCPSGATGTPPQCVCPAESVYGPQGNKCVSKDGGVGGGGAPN